MEYCFCANSQYIGKSECSMNLGINTHRNDVRSGNGPLWDKHFQNPGQKYHPKQQRRSFLEHREDFWILRLEIHSRKGLFVMLYILKLSFAFLHAFSLFFPT